jgi:hypothetical protein
MARSGCDNQKSIYASLQLITEYGVDAIIGPSCTSITATITKTAFFYDIPVIGYSIPRCARQLRVADSTSPHHLFMYPVSRALPAQISPI